MLLVTIGGFSSLLFIILMMFEIIPAPGLLTEFSLSGRRFLWSESIDALQRQPILGYNFSGTSDIIGDPHNSYLRMFLGFGFIGGTIYSILSISTAVDAAQGATSLPKIVLTMLLVAFVIIQVFNQLSFIGISMRSTLIALAMGYFITNSVKDS